MRSARIVVSLLILSVAGYAQSDRGSITGVVADPAGAVVANAVVDVKNVETGAVYHAATTNTGNYSINELPTGTYELSVTVPGFKKYVRQNLTLLVQQTLRIDTVLEVGAATESITVSEATSLLKTESGELSHNVTANRMNDLPILSMSTNIRQPLAVTQLLPGTVYTPIPRCRT